MAAKTGMNPKRRRCKSPECVTTGTKRTHLNRRKDLRGGNGHLRHSHRTKLLNIALVQLMRCGPVILLVKPMMFAMTTPHLSPSAPPSARPWIATEKTEERAVPVEQRAEPSHR